MGSKMKLVAVMVCAGLVSACSGGGQKAAIHQTPAEPQIASEYQGVWLSTAYADALVVKEDSVKYYKYTSDYCVLQQDFDDVNTAELTRSVELNADETALNWIAGYGTQNFGAPSRQLLASSDLPASCEGEVLSSESSLTNPELFSLYSQIMQEYYVDFSRNDVDWPELTYAQSLTVTSADSSLFDAIHETLVPLADSHNSWQIPGEGEIKVFTKQLHIYSLVEEYADANGLSYPLVDAELSNAKIAAINTYIEHELSVEQEIVSDYATTSIYQDQSGQMTWFKINDTGFLRIDSMSYYSTADEDEDDLAQTTSALDNVNEALDDALDYLQDTNGLILDIRYNGGGNDYISLAIASRFAEADFLAYKKYARDGNSVTETQEVVIEPSSFVQYTGKPVALLVSGDTASAAETFSLSMKQLDNVVLIGESTHGIFSDILEWVLPGGHMLGLSNEVYLSPDDVWYEGEGIPVDVEVPFFSLEDRESGVDSAIDTAITVLE